MEKGNGFNKRMAEKAIGNSAGGKALMKGLSMLGSFAGCSGAEPMGNRGGEIVYPKGEKMCYVVGSHMEKVVLLDDITENTSTVPIIRADGRRNQVDKEYLIPEQECASDKGEWPEMEDGEDMEDEED